MLKFKRVYKIDYCCDKLAYAIEHHHFFVNCDHEYPLIVSHQGLNPLIYFYCPFCGGKL